MARRLPLKCYRPFPAPTKLGPDRDFYVVEKFSKEDPGWKKIDLPEGDFWKADLYAGAKMAREALMRWIDNVWDNRSLEASGFRVTEGIPCFGKDSEWCYKAICRIGGEYFALENNQGEVVEIYIIRPVVAKQLVQLTED